MTIAEELHQMGIPKAECSALARKIVDAAAVSGTCSAVDRMLTGIRILIHSKPECSPEIKITTPNYFEDDEVCGYCQRKPGNQHEGWCRQ